VKAFVPTIDRKDLITEQDLDEDPDCDDLDTVEDWEEFDFFVEKDLTND
jgi:hypothetical protein